MFDYISREHPGAERVKGGSWLYNREENRRLDFPASGASARADHPHLIARGLWGQFLRHGNRLNKQLAADFLARVKALRNVADYAACFPYQNLLTEAPVRAF